MIVEPDQRVPDFIKAGADIVSVHAEQSSTIHLHRSVNQVRFPSYPCDGILVKELMQLRYCFEFGLCYLVSTANSFYVIFPWL